MNNSKHNQNIVEPLSQLRDLLVVIERSGEAAPDVLYKIAIEKSQYITSLVEAWQAEANPAPVEIPAEYALYLNNQDDEVLSPSDEQTLQSAEIEDAELTVEHISLEEQFMDLVVPVTEQEEVTEQPHEEVEADEYIAPFVEDELIEYQPQQELQPQSECVGEEASVEFTPDDNSYEDCEETPVATTEVEEESYIEDDQVVMLSDEVAIVDYEVVESNDEVAEFELQIGIDDDDDNTESDDENESLNEDVVMDDFYNQGEPFDNETVTIGDMMSMRQAKELRKAFSLNDRFRFRRELFGNSDINMNDTLNLIDTMSSYEEAEEYLTQDMGWRIDEVVVQEFLQLVERHFRQK